MNEIIEEIVNEIEFERKELFTSFLFGCIKLSKDTEKSTYATHENIAFSIDKFFSGFSPFNNECGKDKKLESGVHALMVIMKHLGVEVDPEECFILFHLRDLGKFRKKESTLHDELKALWKRYKHYALEDQAFSYALKNMMRKRLINYRKGNLYLCKTLILRYRH